MRIEASHNRNNRIIGKNPRLRQFMWGDIFMLYIELYMKAVPLKYSGGSRGGARGEAGPPLFLDQTETRRVWMTALPPTPPYLSQGLHPVLKYSLQLSTCFPWFISWCFGEQMKDK